MRIKVISLVQIVRLLFFCGSGYAQNLDHHVSQEAVALKKQLASAQQDSTRLRLTMALGIVQQVRRESFWDSALAKAKELKNSPSEITALNELGVSQNRKNKPTAITYFNRSLYLSEITGNKRGAIAALWNIAMYHLYSANIDKALEACYRGVKLCEELGDQKRIAEFEARIGSIYHFSGESSKALEYHHKSLSFLRKTNDSVAIAGALFDLGTDYQAIGDTGNSIHYYMETRNYLHGIIGNKHEGEIYEAIAAAFSMRGQQDSCRYFVMKSYTLWKEKGDVYGVASALGLMGSSSMAEGNLTRAKKELLESVELSKKANFTIQIPPVLLSLKALYIMEKDFEKALAVQEEYIMIRDSSSNEKNRKLALQKQFEHAFEEKVNENKFLAQQNKIQGLELRQNNYFLLGVIALLILIFIIAYLFSRQSKIQARQQRAELEQKLLRSQMNPHFIFNSLQAIQYFIVKQDEQQASRYLSSFAAITRSVLENSRMEVITLTKEISLLENYLLLQKLRFKNRFNYQISTDSNIDPDRLHIPPMLSQPFIENAIEHGFQNIETEGLITISYSIKNNMLIMEITDNGTGIKQNTPQSKQHQSLAIEITKERVDLMNKKAKGKAGFTMAEAFPEHPERKGVRVVFTLPLQIGL